MKLSLLLTAYLGEMRIREMNDELNRLKGELHRWNLRIVALGGQNHERGRRIYDKDGNLISSGRDYLYFGAAKDLPGVKERISQPKQDVQPTRQDRLRSLDRHINPEYYNFNDVVRSSDNSSLLDEEMAAEKRVLERNTARWEAQNKNLVGGDNGNDGEGDDEMMDVSKCVSECEVEDDYDEVLLAAVDDIEQHGGNVFAIASEEEEKKRKAEEEELEKKKRELMEKFLSKEYLN